MNIGAPKVFSKLQIAPDEMLYDAPKPASAGLDRTFSSRCRRQDDFASHASSGTGRPTIGAALRPPRRLTSSAVSAPPATREHAGSMLPCVWNLEAGGQVVRNVEGLCRAVLNRQVAKLGRTVSDADYAEALAFLLGEAAVIAAEKWPPRRERYPSLGGYLAIALPTALVDHWRGWFGRDGYKRVVDTALAGQAVRDAGAEDFDWTPAEPIDDSLEARVEDLVLLRELVRLRPADPAAFSGRTGAPQPPRSPALAG